MTYHQLRHRNIGDAHWVEFHLVFPDNTSLVEAHRIATAIEREVEGTLTPRAYVTTHLIRPRPRRGPRPLRPGRGHGVTSRATGPRRERGSRGAKPKASLKPPPPARPVWREGDPSFVVGSRPLVHCLNLHCHAGLQMHPTLLKPALSALPRARAHEGVLRASPCWPGCGRIQDSGVLRPHAAGFPTPGPVGGFRWSTPIGIGTALDPRGIARDAWARFGVGFVELGVAGETLPADPAIRN